MTSKTVSTKPRCAPLASLQPDGAENTRQTVREKYGQAVVQVSQGATPACCGSKTTVLAGADPITRDLYSVDEASGIPRDALAASFGCGNPTALARLKPGQRVLDLGSGGGIDVLLSARRVGPHGKAYGLDMTPEMLALARNNQRAAGIENAEFLEGTIEKVPMANNSVDVVISNCVINLSADKDQALREAFRVLAPGGWFAVSDIVLTRELPLAARQSIELWAGCIAGALLTAEYQQKLGAVGFVDISIEPTRIYSREDAKEMVSGAACCGSDAEEQLAAIDGAAMSAFIRARKPANAN